jgi:bifunctional non-homologous end joining protein LigD
MLPQMGAIGVCCAVGIWCLVQRIGHAGLEQFAAAERVLGVFRHACKLGLEGIVSKRKDSPYRSGRSPDWLKFKNPDAPAVKREAEADWFRS